MAARDPSEVVGLDPEAAERLVALFEEASASLDAQAGRVQSLLDLAGVPSTAPAQVCGVARTCGAEALDVRRRAGLIRSSIPLRGRPSIGGWTPGWRAFWRTATFGPTPPPPGCDPPPAVPETPTGPAVWTTLGAGVASGGLRTGPWVTPPASERTGPWVTPPAPQPTGPWVVPGPSGGPLLPDPSPTTATFGVPGCDIVHSNTARRWGPGQPVPAPRTLPAFPSAVRDKPKTPVHGGGLLRRRWRDPDGRIYEWDGQHGKVEVYDRRGRHRGEFDPDSGAQTKPADPSRKVKP